MVKLSSSQKSSIYNNKSITSMSSMTPGDKKIFMDNVITNTFFNPILFKNKLYNN